MGLNTMSRGDRLVGLDAGRGTVLLLFRRGATTGGFSFPGGRIPPHDGEGPAHFAFAVATEDLDAWRDHLAENGVEIESEVTWSRGGESLYFRDPDGHSVELATPGFGKSIDAAVCTQLWVAPGAEHFASRLHPRNRL